MNKFVKRYPRAVVRKSRKGKLLAHIIRHPAETPNDQNVTAVAHAHERHLIHHLAVQAVNDHRSEPS